MGIVAVDYINTNVLHLFDYPQITTHLQTLLQKANIEDNLLENFYDLASVTHAVNRTKVWNAAAL